MTENKYYTASVSETSKSEQEFLVSSYNKTRAKSFFHKLGNSLGLVVVTLPLAGLLAAIGGIVVSYADTNALYTFGLIIKNLGQTVLANLGLLFMLAIIIGFTGNKGMAVYVGLIGYVAFIGFSIPFIRYSGSDMKEFSIWFWKDLNSSTQLANVFGYGIAGVTEVTNNTEFIHPSWNGVQTLSTGVLGGIVLGFVYTYVYNKFKDLKLPTMLAFFEGEKFVALLCIVLAPVIASLFIIIWPAINYGLEYIGIGLSYLPYGIDAFFEGMITRLLLPFESHPAFYGPLWWTSAGGGLSAGSNQLHLVEATLARVLSNGDNTPGIGQELSYYNDTILPFIESIKINGMNLHDFLLSQNLDALTKEQWIKLGETLSSSSDLGLSGDQATRITDAFAGYSTMKWDTQGDQLMAMELLNNPNFDMRDAWAINLKVTRFISGGYGLLMFIIPTIGVAMWSTLDKETRSKKFGYYMGAVLTCFLLGITEPIEFMFAFTAPLIYFAMYAPFYGIFFGAATLFQVKLGSTFSQGLLDYVVNAIIPTVTRTHDGVQQTNLWVPLIIGIVGAVVAFPLFRWIFIKFEFAAPGSLAAEEGVGVSTSKYSRIKEDYDGLISYLGGTENIQSVELKSETQALVNVKRTELVANNEFTDSNMKKSVQQKNLYTITLNTNADGMEYLAFVKDIVDLNNKTIDVKKLKQQEAREFKEFVKDSKKNGNDVSDIIAERKAQLKVFKIQSKRFETINKINAHWQFKEDELLNTSDIDKLKYAYKTTLWAKEHKQEKQIAKANYKADMKLANAIEKDQIKNEFNEKMNSLTVNKEEIKNDNLTFKSDLKALKLAKKEEFAKERNEAKAKSSADLSRKAKWFEKLKKKNKK